MADISAEADTAIYLEHCDPERNTSRFYALSVHPTLFKSAGVRVWQIMLR